MIIGSTRRLLGGSSFDVIKLILKKNDVSSVSSLKFTRYPRNRAHGAKVDCNDPDPSIDVSVGDFLDLGSYQDIPFAPTDYEADIAMSALIKDGSVEKYLFFLDLEVDKTEKNIGLLGSELYYYGSGYLFETQNSYHYISDGLLSKVEMRALYRHALGWLIKEGADDYYSCVSAQEKLTDLFSDEAVHSVCAKYLEGENKIPSIKRGDFRKGHLVDPRHLLHSLENEPHLRLTPKYSGELTLVDVLNAPPPKYFAALNLASDYAALRDERPVVFDVFNFLLSFKSILSAIGELYRNNSASL